MIPEGDASSYQFAADTAKQFITYSTAILTLTVTFAKDTFLKHRTTVPRSLLLSWVCYLVSIIGGVWTLLALTASIDKGIGIWETNVSVPASVLVSSFLLGMVCTIIAGWVSTRGVSENAP